MFPEPAIEVFAPACPDGDEWRGDREEFSLAEVREGLGAAPAVIADDGAAILAVWRTSDTFFVERQRPAGVHPDLGPGWATERVPRVEARVDGATPSRSASSIARGALPGLAQAKVPQNTSAWSPPPWVIPLPPGPRCPIQRRAARADHPAQATRAHGEVFRAVAVVVRGAEP